MSNAHDQPQRPIYPDLQAPESLAEACVTVWRSALDVEVALPNQPTNIVLLTTESDEDSSHILKSLLDPISPVSVTQSTTPLLPGFVSSNSLVLACSSTGIDREIIECIEAGLTKDASVVCISSNGPIADFARKVGIPLYSLPQSFTPYATNGYLFIPALALLVRVGLIDDQTPILADALDSLSKKLTRFALKHPLAENDSRILAEALADRSVLVIGSSGSTESMAFHWYQQLTKAAGVQLVDWDILPDFPQGGAALARRLVPEQLVVVLLTSDDDPPPMVRRVQDLKTKMLGAGITVEEVRATGNSRLERHLSLLALGDYVGEYLMLIHRQKSLIKS